jgi:hypothetical protein
MVLNSYTIKKMDVFGSRPCFATSNCGGASGELYSMKELWAPNISHQPNTMLESYFFLGGGSIFVFKPNL